MPVLIYMESAYRRADGTGVIRCEAMLPGDGQATISTPKPDAIHHGGQIRLVLRKPVGERARPAANSVP